MSVINFSLEVADTAFQHTLHPKMMRAYFAAHAPDAPHSFSHKQLRAVVTDAWGEKREAMRPEDEESREIRWRWHYADLMMAEWEKK